MDKTSILITIALMALVSFIPRILPVWILANRKFPKAMVIWLKYVPVAVLSALLAPELLLRSGHVNMSQNNLFFWISIPTIIVATLTKNLFITIIFGMGSLALVRLIFGL